MLHLVIESFEVCELWALDFVDFGRNGSVVGRWAASFGLLLGCWSLLLVVAAGLPLGCRWAAAGLLVAANRCVGVRCWSLLVAGLLGCRWSPLTLDS